VRVRYARSYNSEGAWRLKGHAQLDGHLVPGANRRCQYVVAPFIFDLYPPPAYTVQLTGAVAAPSDALWWRLVARATALTAKRDNVLSERAAWKGAGGGGVNRALVDRNGFVLMALHFA
jgi:hypothetical protein